MGLIFNGNGDVIKAVDGSLTVEGLDLGGSSNIVAGIVTGTSANFTGNVSVGGVLTYEDVKNVDSVGIVTARTGIHIDDSITHIGDTNTKIRFPGADTFSVETSGSERLRITSAGTVGINRTSPNHTLEVGGNVYITANTSTANEGAGLLFQAKAGGFNSTSCAAIKGLRTNDTSSYLVFETGGTTERLRITSAGLVGINCTPSKQLQVKGLDVIVRLESTAATGRNILEFYDSSAAKGSIGYPSSGNDNFAIQQAENADMYFTTNDTEKLRITSSGQVCMGNYFTSQEIGDYTAALQVGGTNANSACISINRWTNSAAGACLQLFKGRGTSGGAVDKGQNGDVIGSITFVQANNNNLDGQGNTARIDCNIDDVPGGGDYPGRLSFWTCPNGSTTLAERLRIHNTGVVQVSSERLTLGTSITNGGTNDGNFVVEFASNSRNAVKLRDTHNAGSTTYMVLVGGSATVGSITGTTGQASFNNLSDYRSKENDVKITDGITKVKLLRPIRFNYKVDPDTLCDGFFAHEVTTSVPTAVTGEKDAVDSEGEMDPQMLDTSKMVPLLTAALQEAIARIETLEIEVTGLKSS